MIWGLSLRDLLARPLGIHYFHAFLKAEYCDENLLFWNACMDLSACPDKASYVKACRNMYHVFIVPASPHEVNIADDVRQELCDQFEAGKDKLITETIFVDAQKAVFSLMARDSYPRFLQSQAYQDLLKANEA